MKGFSSAKEKAGEKTEPRVVCSFGKKKEKKRAEKVSVQKSEEKGPCKSRKEGELGGRSNRGG